MGEDGRKGACRDEIRPRDWLLLLLALPPAVTGGLDPVRIQKGAFLLAQEGGLPCHQAYEFVPYTYGPMSPALYRDVEELIGAGLAERVPVPGYSWGRVRPTPRGLRHARRLIASQEAAAATVRMLGGIKEHVTRLSFAELLSDVYERYPAFAMRSVFRRP